MMPLDHITDRHSATAAPAVQTRFVCDLCDEVALARPSALLLCGHCKWPMFTEPVESSKGLTR